MTRRNVSARTLCVTTSLVVAMVGISSLSGCAQEKQPTEQTVAATTTSPDPAKDSAKGSTSQPTPTGTLAPKLEFTCANLETSLGLTGYALNSSYAPGASTFEGRAVASGGKACKFQSSSGDKWITASVQKISQQDYRDFAASLAGQNIVAHFGTTNDSMEFYSTDSTISSAKILNTTYLIVVQSNSVLSQPELGASAHKTELLLIG